LRERALAKRRERREEELALMAQLDRRHQRESSRDSETRSGRRSRAEGF
jgi:hypothetical protein